LQERISKRDVVEVIDKRASEKGCEQLDPVRRAYLKGDKEADNIPYNKREDCYEKQLGLCYRSPVLCCKVAGSERQADYRSDLGQCPVELVGAEEFHNK